MKFLWFREKIRRILKQVIEDLLLIYTIINFTDKRRKTLRIINLYKNASENNTEDEVLF